MSPFRRNLPASQRSPLQKSTAWWSSPLLEGSDVKEIRDGSLQSQWLLGEEVATSKDVEKPQVLLNKTLLVNQKVPTFLKGEIDEPLEVKSEPNHRLTHMNSAFISINHMVCHCGKQGVTLRTFYLHPWDYCNLSLIHI